MGQNSQSDNQFDLVEGWARIPSIRTTNFIVKPAEYSQSNQLKKSLTPQQMAKLNQALSKGNTNIKL